MRTELPYEVHKHIAPKHSCVHTFWYRIYSIVINSHFTEHCMWLVYFYTDRAIRLSSNLIPYHSLNHGCVLL